jgi:hypothetical protein
VPAIKKGEKKKQEDAVFTNQDEEFEGGIEERDGVIWYIGKPGLQKCCTPMGEELRTERAVLRQPFVVIKS